MYCKVRTNMKRTKFNWKTISALFDITWGNLLEGTLLCKHDVKIQFSIQLTILKNINMYTKITLEELFVIYQVKKKYPRDFLLSYNFDIEFHKTELKVIYKLG